jgi:hypothetical protein
MTIVRSRPHEQYLPKSRLRGSRGFRCQRPSAPDRVRGLNSGDGGGRRVSCDRSRACKDSFHSAVRVRARRVLARLRGRFSGMRGPLYAVIWTYVVVLDVRGRRPLRIDWSVRRRRRRVEYVCPANAGERDLDEGLRRRRAAPLAVRSGPSGCFLRARTFCPAQQSLFPSRQAQ